MNDDEVNVIFGASTSGIVSGANEAKAVVASSTQAMRSSVQSMAGEVTAHAGRTSAAFRGMIVASHEVVHSFGLTGIAGRMAGHEMADLTMGLGTTATALGIAGAAATAGYMIYEHFAEASKKAAEAVIQSAESDYSKIKSVEALKGETLALQKAEYDLYTDRHARAVEETEKAITQLTEQIKDQVEIVNNGGTAWERFGSWSKNGILEMLEGMSAGTADTSQFTEDMKKSSDKAKNALAQLIDKLKELKVQQMQMSGGATSFKGFLKEGDEDPYARTKGTTYAQKTTGSMLPNTLPPQFQSMTEYNFKKVEEDMKTMQQAIQPVFDSFNRGIKGMVDGTMTLSQAMQTMAKSVVNDFVDMGLKTAEAAAMQLVKDSAIAQAKVATAADVTGANTTAWYSSVDPEMAIPMGMAMKSSTQAIFSVPSLRGGGVIDAGVNPLAQLHENEMVLPAELSDRVKNMTSGGGGDVHIHIPQMTGHDQTRQFFLTNGSHIVDALKKSMRNFKG